MSELQPKGSSYSFFKNSISQPIFNLSASNLDYNTIMLWKTRCDWNFTPGESNFEFRIKFKLI